MPLRDHFHPPFTPRHSWEPIHGGWPMMIVQHLFAKLPPQYESEPQVHLGDRSGYEVDIGQFELDEPLDRESEGHGGGAATLTWAPPAPSTTHAGDIPDEDVYEVRVYDAERERRLVAAIELVSPRNKDRPESRRRFAQKVSDLVRQDVCVSVVDTVTVPTFNLYAEWLNLWGRTDASLGSEPPAIYAVTLRRRELPKRRVVIDTWHQVVAIGAPLPTLHVWLNDTLGVTVDLETTYEETCRFLKIR